MKEMKKQLKSLLAVAFSAVLIFGYGCSSSENKEATTDESEVVVEDVIIEDDVIVEDDVWVVDEHQINDIPVTSKATSTEVNSNAAASTAAADAEAQEEADVITMEAIDLALAEQEYIAETTIEVTEVAIPLDETQTVVSYSKKGEPQAAFQVVSDPNTGEVQQIIFEDKKHQDTYNVQTGMTGKETKKLRKELKHMVKKGQVFLYDDQSNIMYLMDAQNMAGDEVTAADVETMEVQAIIWKDKKHHKKDKNKKDKE